LAIIGCGAVVSHHLAPALRRIGWIPTVLVDPRESNIAKVAARLGRKPDRFQTTADFASVVDRFDAAIVASPHVTHGPIGLALAAAGKHIFVEKPLAITAAEGRATVDAADRTGVAVTVGLLRRYLHVCRWTKALIGSGLLGDLERFEAREGFVFNWATSTDALFRRESAGGGVLMDTGAHTLDLLQWWFGAVDGVRYWDDAEGGTEADCRLALEFESGLSGTLELSRTRELRNTLRLEGSHGFVEVHLYKNEVVDASPAVREFVHDGLKPGTMPKQMFAELFDAELADFRATAGGGPRRGVQGAEAIRSVEVIERCYAGRRPLTHPWEAIAIPPGPPVAPAIGPGTVVAITGATGFIGGRLAERLATERGATVRCLVRGMAGAARLARLPVELIPVDLADADAVGAAVAGAEYVFHCAYDVRSQKQNMAGTANLVAACGPGSGVRRLVHLSTFSVYEPFADGELSEETADGDRAWQYARTKLDLEQMVLGAARASTCPGTVLQPSIVYGPFGKPWTNAPAEMLLYGTVVLPERGEGLCNGLYVDDLVDAMLLAATREEAIGERFVISGPEPARWDRFFGRIADALGVAPPVLWPAERIKAAQGGIVRDLRMVLNDPKKIIQLVVRWNPARRFLQAGLDGMPRALQELVTKYYFDRPSRPIGQVHVPDRQLLSLYSAKPVARIDKARRLLGYEPRFHFDDGMAVTVAYLKWAYGDQVPAHRREAAVETRPTPLPETARLADAS